MIETKIGRTEKRCKTCGLIKPESDFYFENRRGRFRNACKKCENKAGAVRANKYYEKLKEEKGITHHMMRNKEKHKTYKAKSYKKMMEQMPDKYIRKLICSNTQIDPELVPQVLVDCHKINLKIKREIRGKKNEEC